jgi:hypothetical protein
MDWMVGQPRMRRERRNASQDSRERVSSGNEVAGKGVRFIGLVEEKRTGYTEGREDLAFQERG